MQRDQFFHLRVMHTFLGSLSICHLLQIFPSLEVRLHVGLQSLHVQASPVLNKDNEAILLLLLTVFDALEEDFENLLVEAVPQ